MSTVATMSVAKAVKANAEKTLRRNVFAACAPRICFIATRKACAKTIQKKVATVAIEKRKG